MKNYQVSLTILSIISASFLFSCQKSTTNDLHDAQLCLNGATADTAMGCVDKISGDSSPTAYSLRCSAIFISQGYGSAASFIDALDSINGGTGSCTGGCSSTVSAITSLKFGAAGISNSTERNTNIATAADAFTQCSQADAKIYTQIASLFQLGTITSMVAYNLGTHGAGGAPNEDDIKAALTDPSVDAAVVGTLVTVTYDNTCSDPEHASDSTKAYCDQLKTAIDNGSNPTAIGSCLLNKLAQPSYVCP